MKSIACLSFSRLALIAAFSSSLNLAAALAGDPVGTREMATATKDVLIVKDSKEEQTIDAASRDVTINGSHNKLKITGQCHALTVSGDLNFVTVEAVASISLPGGGNQVAWGKAVDGEKPQITDQGKGNTVSKMKAE